MRAVLILFFYACSAERVASGVVVEARGAVLCNGEPIGPGDEVFTGDSIAIDDGRLEFEVNGVGRMRVFRSTKLELTGKPHDYRLILASGKVWAIVSKLAGDTFEIEGPTAVAGVRGTEFIVESTDDGDDVRVIKGDVDVASTREREKPRRVRGGERMRTRRREAPSEPERYDHASDRAQWDDLKTSGREIKEGFKKGGRAVRDNTRKVGRKIRDLFR